MKRATGLLAIFGACAIALGSAGTATANDACGVQGEATTDETTDQSTNTTCVMPAEPNQADRQIDLNTDQGAKPEAQPAAQDANQDASQDASQDGKPEAKSEAKPEVKPEAKPAMNADGRVTQDAPAGPQQAGPVVTEQTTMQMADPDAAD